MDQNISKAIELIEQKIQTLLHEAKSRQDEATSLQGVKAQLLSVFGSKNGSEPKQAQAQLPLPESSSPRSQTRKQQIVELIRSRGPMRRAEITEMSGVPRGTVAFVLNDKELFRQLKDGRWDIVEKDSAE